MDEKRYVGTCPRCGGRIEDSGRLYVCENAAHASWKGEVPEEGACNWRLWKTFRGSAITDRVLERLIGGEEVRLECRTQGGEAYGMTVFLDPDRNYALYPVRRVVGTCPACGARLLEGDRTVRCENNHTHQADGAWVNDGTCSFRVQKTINGVDLSMAEVLRLAAGEEVLLRGLKGRSGKAFDAWVRLDAEEGFRPTFRFDDEPE